MFRREFLLYNINMCLKIAESEEVKKSARFSPRYFVRKRKMPFRDVVLYTLISKKQTLQLSLNYFFRKYRTDILPMSEQAYSKSRNHFDYSPFKKMFDDCVVNIYQNCTDLKTLFGKYLFAIDGSHVSLPNTPELRKKYGTMGVKGTAPMTRASAMYDVLNDVFVDATINTNGSNEAENALPHIEWLHRMSLVSKALLLFDRGYLSIDFINKLPEEVSFIFRVRRKLSIAIDNAKNGDVIEYGNKKIRVIKFMLDSGEEEVLATNLFDVEESEFKDLYFERWGIEIKYGILKNRVELESFTGKTENAVLQDFWANFVIANLLADAKSYTDAHMKDHKKQTNKYEYKANNSKLIGMLKEELFAAFFASPDERILAFDRFREDILRAAIAIREGRHFSRGPNKKTKYSFNNKHNA